MQGRFAERRRSFKKGRNQTADILNSVQSHFVKNVSCLLSCDIIITQ